MRGLAKVAKYAAALNTEGFGEAEALEEIMLAIESGQGRGLREIGIFVNPNKETERAQKLAEPPERYIGCKQKLKEAVNDRFVVSVADDAA